MNILPVARKRNIVVQELPDELLVYDLERNRALCLNQTAKLILEKCDGKTTVDEAATNINRHHQAGISHQIFFVALEQLRKNHLLDDHQPIPEIPKVSRRELIKSGLTLSISLPLITSLTAPSAVNAQSLAGNCMLAGEICDATAGAGDCCPEIGISCSMQLNGVCCIIESIACDPNNDLCCITTVCDPNTLTCTCDPLQFDCNP